MTLVADLLQLKIPSWKIFWSRSNINLNQIIIIFIFSNRVSYIIVIKKILGSTAALMDYRALAYAVLKLWLVSIRSIGLLCVLGALLGVTGITGLSRLSIR